MMSRSDAIALLIAGPLLASCSGEPSEAEMRAEVEAGTRRAVEAAGRPFTGFDSFRKQGCVKAKENSGARPGSYDCYYAATFAPHPGAKPLTVNGKARFLRTDKGMIYQDMGAQPR